MVLTNFTAYLCLFSLCVVFLGAGLLRLDRLDRRRMEYYRQTACRWHEWQISEEGNWFGCALCGRRSRMVNPSCDQDPEPIPSDTLCP